VKESKATTRAMPTIQVGSGSSLELHDVADIMGKSRKVVVVTGAGISTNCGIPVSDIQTVQNII
jgi:accessory colonization factor AcfC